VLKFVYTVDPNHTTVGFSARHMMVTRVRGRFKEWSGQVEVEDNNPLTAVATLTINSATGAQRSRRQASDGTG
jgi:polyisoprenoid-binding protein YceI